MVKELLMELSINRLFQKWIVMLHLLFMIMIPAVSFAADLVGVTPITNKILMLHFDEGYANYGPNLSTTQLFKYELDVVNAQMAANYTIISANDPNYSTPLNPIGSVGRKSKGTDFGDVWKSTQYVSEHWIYIELPTAMQAGKQYTLSISNFNLGNSPTVTFTFDPNQLRSSSIHVTQIGFQPTAPKYAYISHWMGDKGPVDFSSYNGATFRVVNTSNGVTDHTGTVALRKALSDGSPQTSSSLDGSMTWFGNGALDKNYTEADVWECDFSSFTSTGEYVIVVEGMGSSLPFKIGNDVYREAYRTASKGLFWQRAGIEKEIEPGKTYPRGHYPNNDVKMYYQPWRWQDEPSHSNPVNMDNEIDGLWGWYYDAGDWDGYQRHAKVPFTLLLLYDLQPNNFKDGDVGNKYVKNETGQWYNEGTNGIPDLLDEALWLINYYKRGKDVSLAAGLGTGGVPGAYAGEDAGVGGLPSWEDTRPLKISAEDPITTFNYAALSAWLATCLDKSAGGTHPESTGWVAEAEAAYTWAVNNTLAGDEASSDYKEARMLASLALYRYTQQQSYHNDFVAVMNDIPTNENGWFGYSSWELAAGVYGLLPTNFPHLDASLQADLQNAITSIADGDYVQTANDRGYRLGFDWIKASSNGTTTTPMFYPLAIAYEITGDSKYLDAMNTTANYYLGGNPMDLVMMTGLGHNHITSPFHPDSWKLSDTDNKVINYVNLPGYTTYNSVFYDVTGDHPTDFGWSGNEAFSHFTAYPVSPKDTWPVSETRFENRESIYGGEFTVNENNAPMIFAYGYLAGANGNTPKNTAPTVSITAPTANTVLVDGTATTFSVNASDNESIHHVEYYMGWHKLGESATAPYSLTISEFPKAYGSVEIIALAVDNMGAKTLSAPISVEHNNSSGKIPFGGEPAAVPGTIQAENFDEGANGIAYFDLTIGNNTDTIGQEPVDYRPGTDADISSLWDDELSSEHLMIMNTANGEWLEYTVDIAEATLYDISMRILNGAGNFEMSLILDGTDTLINKGKMPQSGWWPLRERDFVNCLALPSGLHTLRFVFDKTSDYVKLNDIRITKSARVAGVTIDNKLEAANAQEGKSNTLTATINPSDASCPAVTWQSLDETIATIDPITGELTGVSIGDVEIVVTSDDNGFQDTLVVTVSPPMAISQPAHGLTLTPGGNFTIEVMADELPGITISKVDFYLGGNLIGSDNTSPYTFDVTSLPAGTHTVKATVVYNEGYTSSDDILVYGTAPFTHDFSPNAIPGKIEGENYDHGGNGFAYYDKTAGNSKGAYRQDDVDIESGSGVRVTGIDNGEWLEYSVDVLETTNYNVSFTYTGSGSSIEIRLDGALVDTLQLPGVGFWPPKTSTLNSIPLSAGTHKLRLTKVSGSFIFDYVEFKREGNFSITDFNAEIAGFESDTVYGDPGDYHTINHLPLPFDAAFDTVISTPGPNSWNIVVEPQLGSSIAFSAEEYLTDQHGYIIYTAYANGVAYPDTIHFIKRGTYDFEGVELVETLPLTDKITMLHFDEGEVLLHGKGEEKIDVVNATSFDVYTDSLPDKATSYLVSSPDDPNYATAVHPLDVYRKSKPTEQGGDPSQAVMEHWIYLSLPHAMQSGKTYNIEMTTGIANNGNTTSLTFYPYNLRSEAVHVNQVGYVPNAGLKVGYIAEWMGDGGGLLLSDYAGSQFEIVDSVSGNVVYTGSLAIRKLLTDAQVDNGNMDLFGPSNNYYGSDVLEADFSAVTGTGTYYLVAEKFGRSFPFEISEEVYRKPFQMTTKFLYINRAGIAKESAYTPFTVARGHHPDDGVPIVRTSVRSIDPHDAASIQAGEMGAYHTYGWYHDAGDWDGYMSHMFVPTALLATYEANPNSFTDNELNIPESGNGLPDILDEAGWLISYFRRNIDADGSVFGGRVTADYSGGSKGSASNSSQDQRVWHVFAADPHTNYAFAALAANYAYNLEIAGVTDSTATLLAEALAAYNWANNPANVLAGDEDKGISHLGNKLNDLKLYAAAALYKLTGEAQYQTDFENALAITSATDDLSNGYNQQWGVWTYVTTPDFSNTNTALKNMLKEATVNWGHKQVIDNAKLRSGRQGSVYDMPPITGSETTPRIFEGIFAHRVATDPIEKQEILDYLYTTADYYLGNNPLNMTWVSGLGERHPEQALHLDSWYNDAGIKGEIVEGIVPYGPVWHGVFDPQNCHCEADADIIQAGWTHDSDLGKILSYPDRFSWPISEAWFDTRYAVLDGEFTVHQNNAYALGAYGYLIGGDGTVSPPTTYTLDVTAVNGVVTKSPDKASYSEGDVVELTATPNTGFDFENWTGDANGTNNPVSVTMNSHKNVTANFIAIVSGQTPYGGSAQLIPGIIQAEHYDEGGEGIAFHDTDAGNRNCGGRSDEVDLQQSANDDGTCNIGWISNGEWLEYTVNVAQTGTYSLDLRVASQSAGGTVEISFPDGTTTGDISFAATGNWQSWTSINIPAVSLSAGEQVMRIDIKSGGFNFNYVEFTLESTPPTTPQPIGQWNFEGDYNDQIGSLDGTASGTVTFTTDAKEGSQAAYFDFNGEIDLGNPVGYPEGNSPRSVALWVKPFQDNWGSDAKLVHLFAYGNHHYNDFIIIQQGPSFKVGENWGDKVDLSSPWEKDVWMHLVVTYDGLNLSAYKNGQLHDSDTITFDTQIGSSSMFIGGNLKDFWGVLDDVKFYDVSLSASEVESLYNQNSGNARVAKNGLMNTTEITDLKLSIYPNPTFNGEMTVETNTPATIKVIDILGAEVKNIKSDGKILLNELPQGAYFIQAITQEGVAVKKVIFK
ncbi:carbohydrate-binding protein [Flexithrix dorotheae]|uniref:carbohydrate-binding protein n=1 Tax=Flexithrix dorotheae TaxID=70993 RepID=UPI00146D7039|nr:carbohydrate-binding protein [Flexithrix dorotheae]